MGTKTKSKGVGWRQSVGGECTGGGEARGDMFCRVQTGIGDFVPAVFAGMPHGRDRGFSL